MRVKSKWHRKAKPKTIEELASVVAFNIWKAASTTVNKMYNGGFNFNSNAQILDVIGEFSAFLLQIADRIAYVRLGEEERVRFVTAMAKHLLQTMDDNRQQELGAGNYRQAFVELLNERAEAYAEFSVSDDGEPSYPFVRYLGDCVDQVIGGEQNKWIPEHVVEVEAPELRKALHKVVNDMLNQHEAQQAAPPSGE